MHQARRGTIKEKSQANHSQIIEQSAALSGVVGGRKRFDSNIEDEFQVQSKNQGSRGSGVKKSTRQLPAIDTSIMHQRSNINTNTSPQNKSNQKLLEEDPITLFETNYQTQYQNNTSSGILPLLESTSQKSEHDSNSNIEMTSAKLLPLTVENLKKFDILTGKKKKKPSKKSKKDNDLP